MWLRHTPSIEIVLIVLIVLIVVIDPIASELPIARYPIQCARRSISKAGSIALRDP